ncbi:MAG TPA: glycosyltransferase family 4 protein [Tepidisphaeraceae bacterium]|nr:glycosyltransferase family 4 protein [Tepidisphaeraceae bacterium]
MKILLHDFGGHAFIAQLSRELARRGHELVHVFSASVQTPQGVLRHSPGDPDTLSFEPIKLARPIVKRALLKRRRQESEHGRRLLELVELHQPDVVICATTPSEIQNRLIRYCNRAGIRTVTWVQDLQGVAAYEILRRKLPIVGAMIGRYYMWLDRRSLRKSDAVVLITESFRPQMRAWGVAAERITCIPNWAPIADLPQMPKSNPWSRRHGLADKTVILYAGTLAMKHNPGLLLALAQRFKSQDNVRVVVASEGASADWLKESAAQNGLDNLLVFPFQPFEELPEMLGSADVLTSVLEPEASAFSVPSKVLAYLCAGRAILLGVPSDNLAARTVRAAAAGLVASPSDPAAFIAAAERLIGDHRLRARCGDSGRRYAEASFHTNIIGDQFEQILWRVVQKPTQLYSAQRNRNPSLPEPEVAGEAIPV